MNNNEEKEKPSYIINPVKETTDYNDNDLWERLNKAAELWRKSRGQTKI